MTVVSGTRLALGERGQTSAHGDRPTRRPVFRITEVERASLRRHQVGEEARHEERESVEQGKDAEPVSGLAEEFSASPPVRKPVVEACFAPRGWSIVLLGSREHLACEPSVIQ
jgi:hypothetical protein